MPCRFRCFPCKQVAQSRPTQLCRSITQTPRFRVNATQRAYASTTESLHVRNAEDEDQPSKNALPASNLSKVTVTGLVRSVRKQKNVAFAHISNGARLEPVQAILSPDEAKDVTNGSYVELYGTWKASPGSGQAHELQVEKVRELGATDSNEFPIQKKSQTNDFLRTLPHLRFRTPFYSLLTRSRSTLTTAITDWYTTQRGKKTIQVHPPLITSSDCEGAGEVFTISPKSSKSVGEKPDPKAQDLYFRDHKYLTVSNQLHLEAYSAELGDVWTLSPTFRAEQSETPRHLSEFYMLEAEFRGIKSLRNLMFEAESLIKYVVEEFAESESGHDLLAYYSNPKHQSHTPDANTPNLKERWSNVLIKKRWTVMTYADAITHLESHADANPNAFTHPPSYTQGLQLEHERHLVKTVSNNTPLFITDYPSPIKPFYMLPTKKASDASRRTPNLNPNQETVACFDLLFPHGTAELIGGSLREHRLEHLIATMRTKNLLKSIPDATSPIPTYPYLQPGESLGSMQWYADLRRFGSSPHGGFGMGFDRLLGYLAGVSNVKDTVGFPRYFGRADC